MWLQYHSLDVSFISVTNRCQYTAEEAQSNVGTEWLDQHVAAEPEASVREWVRNHR